MVMAFVFVTEYLGEKKEMYYCLSFDLIDLQKDRKAA